MLWVNRFLYKTCFTSITYVEKLSTDPALAGYAPRPDYRPLTKFEQRGLRLGHGVWDLVFARRHG